MKATKEEIFASFDRIRSAVSIHKMPAAVKDQPSIGVVKASSALVPGLGVDSERCIIYDYTNSAAVDIVHALPSASRTTATDIDPLRTTSSPSRRQRHAVPA